MNTGGVSRARGKVGVMGIDDQPHHLDTCTKNHTIKFLVLRVKSVFTLSWDAAIRIRIPYSAYVALYTTYIRTYSRVLYS